MCRNGPLTFLHDFTLSTASQPSARLTLCIPHLQADALDEEEVAIMAAEAARLAQKAQTQHQPDWGQEGASPQGQPRQGG